MLAARLEELNVSLNMAYYTALGDKSKDFFLVKARKREFQKFSPFYKKKAQLKKFKRKKMV